RGDGEAPRQRRGAAHGERGRRPGERAGRGVAEGALAVLPAAGGDAPGGLQGACGQRPGGDGSAGARRGRGARRRFPLGRGGRQGERHRGELAGADRRGGVHAVQGRGAEGASNREGAVTVSEKNGTLENWVWRLLLVFPVLVFVAWVISLWWAMER